MRLPTRFLVLAFTFLIALPLSAQHRHLEQTHQLVRYEDLPSWLERAAWIREHILVSNGLWPMPEKTPLNPTVSALIEEDGYRVQTITLETYPGFYLTGTLFLPPGEGPFPAVLSAHGHWSEGRFEDIDRASIPGRALNFAKRGFAVFSYSMIGYNETEDFFPHRFDKDEYQLWGYSAMGLQLWNSIRALDYISAHPDIDPNRIGMTGASGGGTQTFMLTAIDERIKVAAPVNMISAHFQGGCICENAPLLRHSVNNVEIGALAAPRPLLLVSTSGDWTVNTPDVEFPFIQSIYNLFDAADNVKNAHFDYPHNYNKDSRESVYAWFEEHLGTPTNTPDEPPFALPPSATQTATIPSRMISEDELFFQFGSNALAQVGITPPSSMDELSAFRSTYGTAMQHVLHTDSLPNVSLSINYSFGDSLSSTAALIVHGYSHESLGKANELSEMYAGNRSISGTHTMYTQEEAQVNFPDSIQYWSTYNKTYAQTQAQEIIAAAHSLIEIPAVDSLDLIGLGGTGPITLLASTQLPFVRKVVVDLYNTSFDTDYEFLQFADIPLIRKAGGFKTAAALLAPKPLTIQYLPDSELKSWIRRLYNELGAGDMLSLE